VTEDTVFDLRLVDLPQVRRRLTVSYADMLTAEGLTTDEDRVGKALRDHQTAGPSLRRSRCCKASQGNCRYWPAPLDKRLR
jgi:hypothetical protein